MLAPVEVAMNRRYARAHLSPQVVLQSARTNAGRERTSTADLLADLADIDERKHYLSLAYPSLTAYCMGELRLSEDAAAKRIQACRAAGRFPAIFDAVAEGRLHLSGVCLLAPHLTEHTAGELLGAATHKSKAEIERSLAERFPRTDVLAWVTPMPAPSANGSHAPGHAPGHVRRVHDGDRVTPLSTQSYAVQFTMSQGAREKLRYAQTLLGRQVPAGDIAHVFELALDALIPQLERRRFSATSRPRRGQLRSSNPRYVPAHVQRAVWQRDQGQCTFVSEAGHRCEAREDLEFDHLLEVARGGEATVEGIRLLCRAHNQHAAECTYGSEFMRHKRIAAAETRAAARQRAAAEQANDRDVVPWLRALGFSAAEARRAAERCESIPDASLEERVRLALSSFRVRGTRVIPAGRECAAARPPA